MSNYQPNFRYYPLNTSTMVIEIDPGDGSTWPFHYLVYCELNETTGKWELSTTQRVPLGISKDDKTAAIKEACFQLVKMQNGL
jgi:hypothetical protein